MGSWCKRLLDSAALPSPVTVGWSGMDDRKTSKWFLKNSTWSVFMLLMFSGKRLNIWAPLTPKDFSLAFLTADGAALTTALGMMTLPCLPIPEVNWRS